MVADLYGRWGHARFRGGAFQAIYAPPKIPFSSTTSVVQNLNLSPFTCASTFEPNIYINGSCADMFYRNKLASV